MFLGEGVGSVPEAGTGGRDYHFKIVAAVDENVVLEDQATSC